MRREHVNCLGLYQKVTNISTGIVVPKDSYSRRKNKMIWYNTHEQRKGAMCK